MRVPRPERTSLGLGVGMGPPWFGGMGGVFSIVFNELCCLLPIIMLSLALAHTLSIDTLCSLSRLLSFTDR